MPVSRNFGPLSVTALQDAEGPFFEPRETAIPAASPAQWAAADAFDPGSVDEHGRWRLHFRCFAVRHGDGPVTLVDAGIGPADAPASAWAPTPGRLPAELAAAGITPGDVTTVLLTHLHTDHGDTTIAPGVRVLATPGHTPGHQSVLVGDGLLVTGDLFVHAVQLLHPELTYGHDMDPATAAATRRDRLAAARDAGLTLATPHLGAPFVRA
ncbi:MBL fold metallo-hydrolase [Spirilliplanes yamanashiensis]|uniref:Metallo-beta-lactamase domain-containing protein n=1 Tax=Spirilliplanes yamanashiensis TaxID=42233 RepID=A0A8J3YAA7_9ACTN|nr:MBL fold metallo-hydrolase [Spirilliplanes yamanashiensis]MDP9815996.1 glyoxylase-like metal-dependent hydrolase (beta-lactamase superfamily II) [Spirilliplanes yamanashiensis]GIJ04254.1 hypothetical protein Sya03_36060 [Spirilliplanes yamanashiensis]